MQSQRFDYQDRKFKKTSAETTPKTPLYTCKIKDLITQEVFSEKLALQTIAESTSVQK